MILHVKYMVSHRCKLKAIEEMNILGIKFKNVDLGTVELLEDITKEQYNQLDANLRKSGLELLDDVKSIHIEDIKNIIIEIVHHTEEHPKINLLEYINERLNLNTSYLSNLFMEVVGITIQHYYIINRIEKVKEYLLYDQLTLTEIAYRMKYSSVQYLSKQFKMITGYTTRDFIKLKQKRMSNLENL